MKINIVNLAAIYLINFISSAGVVLAAESDFIGTVNYITIYGGLSAGFPAGVSISFLNSGFSMTSVGKKNAVSIMLEQLKASLSKNWNIIITSSSIDPVSFYYSTDKKSTTSVILKGKNISRETNRIQLTSNQLKDFDTFSKDFSQIQATVNIFISPEIKPSLRDLNSLVNSTKNLRKSTSVLLLNLKDIYAKKNISDEQLTAIKGMIISLGDTTTFLDNLTISINKVSSLIE